MSFLYLYTCWVSIYTCWVSIITLLILAKSMLRKTKDICGVFRGFPRVLGLCSPQWTACAVWWFRCKNYCNNQVLYLLCLHPDLCHFVIIIFDYLWHYFCYSLFVAECVTWSGAYNVASRLWHQQDTHYHQPMLQIWRQASIFHVCKNKIFEF